MWQTFITSIISGVVTALVVVFLTHRLSERREEKAAVRARELADRKNAFDREEAIRRETTQRRLDALEKAASAISPALNELRFMRLQADEAVFPDRVLGALSAGCASLQIHFGDIFDASIAKLERQYGECIKSIGAIALASSWLKRRRDGHSQDDGIEGERRNHTITLDQYAADLKALESSMPAFLADLRTAAQFLTQEQKVAGWLPNL